MPNTFKNLDAVLEFIKSKYFSRMGKNSTILIFKFQKMYWYYQQDKTSLRLLCSFSKNMATGE